jgi:hypothetical protein
MILARLRLDHERNTRCVRKKQTSNKYPPTISGVYNIVSAQVFTNAVVFQNILIQPRVNINIVR